MALVPQNPASTTPGLRLVDGGDIATLFGSVNGIQAQDALTQTLQTITASGAVGPHSAGLYVITKSSAAAVLTLAAPTAGGAGTGDDGKMLVFISATAEAHTVTSTGNFGTGSASVNEATFAADAGAGFAVMAYNAKWLVLWANGITFS
jgi:hypothetical protein